MCEAQSSESPEEFTHTSIQGWHLRNGDIIKEKERNYVFVVHVKNGEITGERVRPMSSDIFCERTFEQLRPDWFYTLIDREK